MSNSLPRMISVIALLCVSIGPAHAQPRYDVCRKEMTEYVERTLGQTPTRIEVQHYAEGNPYSLGGALVFVKECNGFHGFAISATEAVCNHIPHYGQTIGTYTHYEGAFEGCKQPASR